MVPPGIHPSESQTGTWYIGQYPGGNYSAIIRAILAHCSYSFEHFIQRYFPNRLQRRPFPARFQFPVTCALTVYYRFRETTVRRVIV